MAASQEVAAPLHYDGPTPCPGPGLPATTNGYRQGTQPFTYLLNITHMETCVAQNSITTTLNQTPLHIRRPLDTKEPVVRESDAEQHPLWKRSHIGARVACED